MVFKAKRAVYKPSFAKQLKDGLRKDHTMSVEKVCQHWGTTRSSYYKWKTDIKEFGIACEIGDQDYLVACMEVGWNLATGKVKGNAIVYSLLMGALHGMSSKTESKVTHEEQIKTVNINIVEARKPVVIEQPKMTALEKLIATNQVKEALKNNEY